MIRFDAVYIRKSDDPQEEKSQIEGVQGYLDRNHITVKKENWFTDTGSRHDSATRQSYQALKKLVQEGRIGTVYVWKQNRMGTKNSHEWGHICYIFTENGSKIVDTLNGKELTALDDATVITTTLDASGSQKWQSGHAADVLRARVSLAHDGMPQSKHAPYGFDKLYTDASGKPLWTAHLCDDKHSWKIINPDGSSVIRQTPPRKTKSDRIKYVLSIDKARIKLVQDVFRWFATECITERTIAIRLNTQNRLHYGKPWIRTTIVDMLRNPAYIGSVRNMNTTRAFFKVYDGEKIVESTNKKKKTLKGHAIIIEGQHEAIIDLETWQTVQTKLDNKATRPQPPRRTDLWLRGVLYCAKCKEPMHIFTSPLKQKFGYICSSNYNYNQTHAEQYNTGCARSWIPHERAEALIKDKIGNMLETLSSTNEADNLEKLRLMLKLQETKLSSIIINGTVEYTKHLVSIFTELELPAIVKRIKRAADKAEAENSWIQDEQLEDMIFDLDKSTNVGVLAIRNLFILWEEEKVTAAKQKVEQLEKDHEKFVKAKVYVDSDKERETINKQLRTIEADIARWTEQTIPLDDQLADMREQLDDYREQLTEATAALTGGEQLRKAELVRSLFEQIILHFDPVKKAKIVDSVFRPELTEWVSNLAACSTR